MNGVISLSQSHTVVCEGIKNLCGQVGMWDCINIIWYVSLAEAILFDLFNAYVSVAST